MAGLDSMSKDIVYVSTDIEANGPVPGLFSMLSIGAAAIRDGQVLSTFTANLELLDGAGEHAETMAWWAQHPEAWADARFEPRPAGEAMLAFREWVEALPGRSVFAAYPATYDFQFVQWYLWRFTGGTPFGHGAFDMKSFAAALLDVPFTQVAKSTMPKGWQQQSEMSHRALDDAIHQGRLLGYMLTHRRGTNAP
jgi:DNA polymerase III alpha subunit (gram-positive type)